MIALPVLTKYELVRYNDFFFIAASDGVWDVLENNEVIDFIEANRLDCVREVQ